MSTIAIGERFTLTRAAGRKTLEPLSRWKPICAALLLSASMTIVSSAQTFTKLADFNGSDGIDPYALVQGKDGNLYGTAAVGGANDEGTVFKMTPDGTVTAIYSFCSKTSCTDGAQPEAGLVLGTDGNFYGTTWGGGENYYGLCTNGCGTVFKVTLSGTLTTLYTFCSESNCYDGENPDAGLVQGTDGNFYGTTERGGPNGRGSIFKITPSALLTTLSSFCPKSGCSAANGENPMAGLALSSDGNFYGTAEGGGTGNQGIVFRMTPSGTLTTLHSFCSQSGCSDGADPQSTLVQGTDGNFYGTAHGGGAHNGGVVFKITPLGELTTLYSFCSHSDCSDGDVPLTGLVQGTDGNFYGTTDDGGTGTSGEGTIFKITPSGAFTSLHSFDGTDGSQPEAVLMQSTNGVFYSTATEGGAGGDGTVFSLSMGLHPFVQALTYRGKVGNTIEFLGQGFTSSTAVSFNGTKSANVKVVSGTYLTATVPSGATTGFVTATASGGTLKSNQTFLVTPQITSFSPESGSAETVVTINGESFKGATSVVFGRVKATSFKVDSYTEITATVPSGAKTGKITVITPGGTATSAGTFTVP
jgi:uncharacterized repeat protein (TIGR03803 family)